MAQRFGRTSRSRRRCGLAAALLALVLTAGAFAAARRGSSPHHVTAPASSVWQRVFADDFSHGLSRARWGRYTGQPAGDPGGWWAPSHVVVRRGVLELATYRDPRFGGRWVSGGVSNARALKQTYGKYLVRFRVDAGRGVAFVLLLWPVRDVWPPEIDFAEGGGTHGVRRAATATLHYGAHDAIVQRTAHADFGRWHVMGVEWTPGRLVYTIDGRRWATVRGRRVPDEPMELALQTQAGTCGDAYAPCPDATTPANVTMQVDWVVAYARRPRSR
jgi:beta-glucanase (GH16 family)